MKKIGVFVQTLINNRGLKKISQILLISPKTVETHVQNILIKIKGNSQEFIKEFVEKSEESIAIKNHYKELKIKSVFESQIKTFAPLINNKNITCEILKREGDRTTDYLARVLKLANINVTIKKTRETRSSLSVSFTKTEKKPITYELQLKNTDKITTKNKVINLVQKQEISIYEIFQNILPEKDFGKDINELVALYASLKLDKDSKKEKEKMIFLLVIVLFTISFAVFWFFYNSKDTVSYNYIIPQGDIFLPREDVTNKITTAFKERSRVKLVALLGGAGSGKTTIARQHANETKNKVSWEINAENKQTIVNSFIGLGYALSSSIDDRKDFHLLLETKDETERNEKLLIFVQTKLKKSSNWFLVYDNVESLVDIKNYLPLSTKVWGVGKVIITTKNVDIKNSTFVPESKVFLVDELSEDEKLKLFTSITNRGGEEAKKFVSNLPPYPLDITVAAYFLKSTGIKYNEYISLSNNIDKNFVSKQEKIISNASDYSKTRYKIVSVSAHSAIKENPGFTNFLLLMSLVDSQNIPRDLLFFKENKKNVEKFLTETKNYYLFNEKPEYTGLIDIHRSIQAMLLTYLKDNSLITEKLLDSIFYKLKDYVEHLIEIEDTDKLRLFLNHCVALEKSNLLSEENKFEIRAITGIINYSLGYDKRAKEILESVIEKVQDPSTVLAYLGGVYRKIGRDYELAISVLKRSIDNKNTKKHTKALALMYLGNVYRTQGSFDKALDALENSASLYQGLEEVGYVAKSRAICYLGVLYREKKQYDRAIKLLRQSMQILKENKCNKFSSVYASTAAHLGVAYRMTGEFQEAVSILEESNNSYKNIRPKGHPDITRNLVNLGAIQVKVGNYSKAKLLLERSVKEYEKTYGLDHIETGKSLNHLAFALIESSDLETAKIHINRAMKILQKWNHPDLYRSLELLGDLRNKEYERDKAKKKVVLEEAINAWEKSLELAKKFFSSESPDIKKLEEKIKKVKTSRF